jgi:hypothetical protein
MLGAEYREFFAATAAAAGALVGLLFVALSVAPRRADRTPLLIRQIRVAAALLAFVNTLAVAMFGLVPGCNVGYPALVFGVIGCLFTAAAVKSLFTSPSTRGHRWQQLGLIALLFVIFGAELVSGALLAQRPGGGTPANVIGYSLVASMLVGVARAWELVGDRDTGMLASLAVLSGRTRMPADDSSDNASA